MGELVKQEKEEKMQKIVKEMEQEKLRIAAKKVQEKESMLRLMRDNVEERKMKDAAKEQQAKMEIEGMREYNRILDLQEAQRAAETESRLTRQKELMEMERNKAEKLHQTRLETQDFLFAQMEEKEARKGHAVELKRLQAKILEEDTREYVRQEHERTLAKKRRDLEHKLELDEQAATKNRDVSLEKFCMSDAEVEMNRQLLEVVDKTLKERDVLSGTGA